MAFKRDLQVGKAGESLARKKMESLGIKTADADGREADFYIVIDNYKKFSCEVKYDLYAEKSGNLAIEYFNTKICKPSGIDSTLCHFWIHVLSPDEVYFSTVENLKKFVKSTKPFRDITSGGDQNSAMFLYRKETICGPCLILLNEESLCHLHPK